MAESDYWNFDLTVVRTEGDEGSYEVKAACQGLDWTLSTVRWPHGEKEDIAALREAIAGPARDAQRVAQGEAPDKQDYGKAVRDFGELLFDTFFGGEILSGLNSSLDKAQGAGRVGLRIRLRLEKAPEIAQLPWEYLFRKDQGQYLSTNPQTPIVRYPEHGTPPCALEASLPIKVLVMIPKPKEKGLAHLEGARELENIQDALKLRPGEDETLVELDTVPSPTLEGLQEQLQKKRYHVFHFIGHGGFGEKNESVLWFEDKEGNRRPVTADKLKVALSPPTLRLVVLNSCEGARSGTRDPFAGIAQQLTQSGKWATIAMQFRITDEAAKSFAGSLYRALANNFPVDAALVEARKTIYFEDNPTEWGTPVLFMRAEDGRVFSIPTGKARLQQQIERLADGAKDAIDNKDYKLAIEKLHKILEKLGPAAPPDS